MSDRHDRAVTLDDLPDEVRGAVRPEAVPAWRSPTLATLTDRPFSDDRWLFERKFDGMRCLAFSDGEQVRLLSRNRKPLDGTYPELSEALSRYGPSAFVVDGEVVAFEGQRTSFARLQQRLGITDPRRARAVGVPVFYYLFDILHLDGRSTTGLPLIWRKRLLRGAFRFTDPLRYSTHRVGVGERAYREACARGDEGVIAKSAPTGYEGHRSTAWLKFKCVRDQEFVIGGYTAPHGSRVGLGALLVGYHSGNDLVYAGKVGTGFDTATLRRLHDRLSGLAQDASPFTRGGGRIADVRWVRPELVAQVAFTEWTRDGRLRHPRYTGLRTDKSADEVVKETS